LQIIPRNRACLRAREYGGTAGEKTMADRPGRGLHPRRCAPLGL